MAAELTFDVAKEKVKDLPADKITDDDKLELYGLFKQATVGDNNTKQPWAVEFTARAKWEAWTKQKGKSSEEAKAEYVKVCQRLGVTA